MVTKIIISRVALKQLKRLPGRIVDKLATWIEAVEIDGIDVVRKLPGYHYEPLKGQRIGQRSIRLSLAYRAIYRLYNDADVWVVTIIEVNKHDYKK
ncbi:MAG: hypothetical protein HQM16_06145 [Deltaproteobacteria bacterium]|nr:hypothetical protein [Deltaproteobacteria bacterium]